jgi:integrase
MLLDFYGRYHAVRDKVISHKTAAERRRVCFCIYETIRDEGEFKIKNIYNIDARHASFVVNHWANSSLVAGTLQGYLSIFRTLLGWLGKPTLASALESYLPAGTSLERNYAATSDKSWSARGVDFNEIFKKIYDFDKYIARQLAVMAAFGLRKKEAIMFRPGVCITQDGGFIRIEQGAKNGRVRLVQITNDQQRAVLRDLQLVVTNRRGHLGNPRLNLEQNMSRFNYGMTKFKLTLGGLGVTGHGLRHQFVNDQYEILIGVATPVRGGDTEIYNSEEGKAVREKFQKTLVIHALV